MNRQRTSFVVVGMLGLLVGGVGIVGCGALPAVPTYTGEFGGCTGLTYLDLQDSFDSVADARDRGVSKAQILEVVYDSCDELCSCWRAIVDSVFSGDDVAPLPSYGDYGYAEDGGDDHSGYGGSAPYAPAGTGANALNSYVASFWSNGQWTYSPPAIGP